MRVNERLKKYVEEKGMKQRALAEKTGFSDNQVSQTLNGKRSISADELEVYCNALNISPNDIYYMKTD